MTSPTDPALPLRYARARLAMLRHVRTELEILDPRTLNGKEDHDVMRLAIDVYLTEIDDEITGARTIIGRLTS